MFLRTTSRRNRISADSVATCVPAVSVLAQRSSSPCLHGVCTVTACTRANTAKCQCTTRRARVRWSSCKWSSVDMQSTMSTRLHRSCALEVSTSQCSHPPSSGLHSVAKRSVCSEQARKQGQASFCPAAMHIGKSMLHSMQCRVPLPAHSKPGARAEAVSYFLAQPRRAHQACLHYAHCAYMPRHACNSHRVKRAWAAPHSQ